MKLRSDFVTNSSSSSFIIGKIGDKTNINVVFHIIRDFYKEYIDAKEKLMKDMDKFGIVYDKKDERFKFKTGKSWDEENRKVDEEIKKLYGIDTWDYFPSDCEWLKFETYAEYEKYWQKRMFENKETSIHAPFSIIDYDSGKTYISLHHGYKYIKELDVFEEVKADKNEEFLWYIACGECLVSGEEINEEYCDYCSIKKENCKEIRAKFKNGELTNDNALVELLGKICIRSECGYIPDFVVEKLSEVSNYHCNHMG